MKEKISYVTGGLIKTLSYTKYTIQITEHHSLKITESFLPII